jgi:hypothetical protein
MEARSHRRATSESYRRCATGQASCRARNKARRFTASTNSRVAEVAVGLQIRVIGAETQALQQTGQKGPLSSQPGLSDRRSDARHLG